MLGAEVGPQNVTDVDLRVADLPEQEVAEAALVGRADEQVRIGQAGGVQRTGDDPLVDVVRLDPTLQHSRRDSPDGVDQLNFDAAVVAADGAVEDLEMMHGPGLGKRGGVFPGLLGGRPDCPKTQDIFLCDPIERDGISYTRTIIYKDADGNPQDQYIEGETASIEYEIWVEGEKSRTGWSATIKRHRTMVVEGLLDEDGDVTWNGSGSGTVTRSRHLDDGTERTYNVVSNSEVLDVVVPYPREEDSWPLSGTITRNLTMTRT